MEPTNVNTTGTNPGEVVKQVNIQALMEQGLDNSYANINTNYQIPALKLNPYNYQYFGMQFMINRIEEMGFVLNADDVGLGKTIQTIGVLYWYAFNRGIKHILIMCKKSIKTQWQQEIEKFTHLTNWYQICIADNTKAKRMKMYESMKQIDRFILIANYELVCNDSEIIKSLGPDMCVIDEVHTIKAREGKKNNLIGSVVRGLPMIFLTGTPIMSKPEDIFGIFQLSRPEYFGDWEDFKYRYCVVSDGRWGEYISGYINVPELREKIRHVIIRRTEHEVKMELPETRIVKVDCKADDIQVKIGDKITSYKIKLLETIDTLSKKRDKTYADNEELTNAEVTLKSLISAEQIYISDPAVFRLSSSEMYRNNYLPLVPQSYTMSDKTQRTVALVQECTEAGHKVIVFSKMKTCIDHLYAILNEQMHVKTVRYTGSEDQDERDDSIDTFKTDDRCKVLLGTEAMAEGLNLQCAKYIINYDQPDCNAIKVQRIGRVRRVGSNFSNVIIYDMITGGDCVDGVIGNTAKGFNICSRDVGRLLNVERTRDLTLDMIEASEAERKDLMESMGIDYYELDEFDRTSLIKLSKKD